MASGRLREFQDACDFVDAYINAGESRSNFVFLNGQSVCAIVIEDNMVGNRIRFVVKPKNGIVMGEYPLFDEFGDRVSVVIGNTKRVIWINSFEHGHFLALETVTGNTPAVQSTKQTIRLIVSAA